MASVEKTPSSEVQDGPYSVILPGEERIRKCGIWLDDELPWKPSPDVSNLYECFQRGKRVSNNGPCLGWRAGESEPYQWMSYEEVERRAKNIGSGLIMCRVKPGVKNFVGVFAKNRPEWTIVMQASYMYSFVIVPLYDTLGQEACNHIINHTELNIMIAEDEQKTKTLLDEIDNTPSLKTIITMDAVSKDLIDEATKKGVEMLLYSKIEEVGSNNIHDLVLPSPSDWTIICFTSGTTGNPKGAILTHKNILSNITGATWSMFRNKNFFTAEDSVISYLPLAHMFEQMVQTFLVFGGGKIGYFRGDVRKLMEDIQELKPTFLPMVPRLLNRLYDKVYKEVNKNWFKRKAFEWALWYKMADVKQGIYRRDTFWDMVVFGRIQSMLGGNVKYMVTGSAPIQGKILDFARCVFGCTVLEAYGQTEATAAITGVRIDDPGSDHVGGPVACNLVKLVDVPDMNYHAKDDVGEICAKGHNIIQGYYKEPEKTKELLDEDGWAHTGDIGMWLPNGTLKVIDRKKHIFKLTQGEYLAPEKIENAYIRCPLILQAFIDGESMQNYAIGVIVPDADTLPAWAKKQGFEGELRTLCSSQEVKEAFLKDITQFVADSGLKSFEQAKKIHLHPEPFTVDNGLLTPTFKAKRQQLRQLFKQQIREMYS